MTGDALFAWPPAAAGLTEPAGGVGWAIPAGAPTLLMDQEFDSGTLHVLRAAVQAHAGQAGLSEDRTEEVVLAVHELAANAIAHGPGHGHLRMWDLVGTLTCEIVDHAPANPDASRAPVGADASRAPANPDASRAPAETVDPWPAADGHGLWLVQQVADQLDLRSGPRGTRAVVTFERSAPKDPCRAYSKQP